MYAKCCVLVSFKFIFFSQHPPEKYYNTMHIYKKKSSKCVTFILIYFNLYFYIMNIEIKTNL